MQIRLLLSCVLLGTLFVALPVAAQMSFYDVPINGTGFVSNYSIYNVTAGAILIGGTNYVAKEGDAFDSISGQLNQDNTQNKYIISMRNIFAGTLATQSAVAVVGADRTGKYTLESNIDFFANVNNSMQGFIIYNQNGDTAFTGQIEGAKNITVHNNGTTTAADAVGLGFFYRDSITDENKALSLNVDANVDVGQINVTANRYGYGFFANDITDASVNLGGVTVESTTIADGLHIEGGVTNNSYVHVGTSGITATSTTGVARGLSITGATTNANVIIDGNVVVEGAKDFDSDDTDIDGDYGFGAIGLQFSTAVSSGDGNIIKTGDITVAAEANDAYGVWFEDDLTNVKTNFGNITVNAKNAASGSAFGILADGTSETILSLTNDITVTSTAGNATGVSFSKANGIVKVTEKDVVIWVDSNDTTSYALNASKNLTLDLDNEKTLTANSVFVNNDLIVRGNGQADLEFVKVNTGSTTTIQGSAVLAVDGAQMAEGDGTLGNVTMQGLNSRLEIYGNTTNNTNFLGTLPGTIRPGQFVNMSSLTNWVVDPITKRIQAIGALQEANVNDNYLAASQIHQKYTGLHAVKDHVISGAVLAAPQYDYYGQSNPYCKPRGAWVNYIGRDSHYRSSYNRRSDWDFASNGVQVGTDIIRTRRDQYGLFFGYEDTEGNNLADRLDTNDYYVGLYGVHVFGTGSDLRVVFNYGWQNFDSVRWHKEQLSSTLHTMSFDGNTAELNVELGKRRYFGNWSARPVVGIDWYHFQLDNGQENGPDAGALDYDGTNLSQLFFRFGSDLRYEWQRVALEGGLYYSFDMLGETLRSGVTGREHNQRSTLVGSKLGRSVLTLNLGASWTMCQNFSAFGGYRGEVTPERSGDGYAHTGYIGGAWRW